MNAPDARIADRVNVTDAGCWEFQGSMRHHGYQGVTVDGRTCLAHRYVYELLVGPIPEGLELDHLCRNKPCCNPSHLEPVTHAENMRRTRLAVCGRGHELNDDTVYAGDGRSGRRCKRCAAEDNKARRHANPGPGKPRGERVGTAVLTEDGVRAIRALRSDGLTYDAIAAEMELKRWTVADVCSGRTWGHVDAEVSR